MLIAARVVIIQNQSDDRGAFVETSLPAFRSFYATLIAAMAAVPDYQEKLARVFVAVPRERFVGPGPWRVLTPTGYIETPTNDPAFLYQDIVVALTEEGPFNNGQPSLHATCLAKLAPRANDTILHVGAGTGYYTALLALLTGESGKVIAYEIEPGLAERAAVNLADVPQVTIANRSGSEGPLPQCDIIYVNAGATAPLDVWLDSLRSGGRLLFPLTPAAGVGGMLLLTKKSDRAFAAEFVSQAMFIPCIGGRDDHTAERLSDTFRRGGAERVKSMRRASEPDETSWFSGNGWWLSTASVD